MAKLVNAAKACTVNPLKMAAPLGACYAFLGMDRCMPLMHGSQGCTSFGLVLLVRHFKEAIPLQTTAMNEVATILGGMDNIEQALLNIKRNSNPALIALATTGLIETRGEDVAGSLRLIEERHRDALTGTRIVHVSTPDYIGAFQDGWEKAVTALIETLVEPRGETKPGQINVLPGCHLTVGDIEEVREIVEAFGLDPIFIPDLSGSLDGHIPETFTATTLGGTSLARLAASAESFATIAIGRHMCAPAQALEDRAGVPFRVFDNLTGLAEVDALLAHLAKISGRPVPAKYRSQRSQLQDAMLDAHFHIGGRRFAIAAEPDLLNSLARLATGLGAEVAVAVTTTSSPLLEELPCEEVLIGDLEDFERFASERDCEILLTHSHGRQAAERLGLPLVRVGLPMFDRIGAAHRVLVGYRGTRETLFEWANTLIDCLHEANPRTWPLTDASLCAVQRCASVSSCTETHSPEGVSR